jgi:NAD(P)-dependent dehydrogenase (short-subunit alcohol dehydrogenase family)
MMSIAAVPGIGPILEPRLALTASDSINGMDTTMARPTAFVTGASYGVGSATALVLARAGYDVAVSATRPENVERTAAELQSLGARVVVAALDLRNQASIEQAFGDVISAFGTLDLLVNNAGANLRKLAVDVTASEWDEVIATNLTGTFFLTQRFGRHLIGLGRPGCIVNVASTHGVVGAAERSTYGISKGAIIQMTRMLAIEWAAHGIRVNAVAPGRLDTPSPSRADTDPKYMAAMLARIPMHRLATAEEVAAAIGYLASAEAGSVTGQIIVLDGGLTAA